MRGRVDVKYYDADSPSVDRVVLVGCDIWEAAVEHERVFPGTEAWFWFADGRVLLLRPAIYDGPVRVLPPSGPGDPAGMRLQVPARKCIEAPAVA